MRNTRIQAIIQARVKSNRLPRKVLSRINGIPLLEFLIRRIKTCSHLTSIVIATTSAKEDDPIVAIAQRLGVHFYRGNSNDVLARFLGTLEVFPADIVVRITADNPLTDPTLIDQLIQEHIAKSADYTVPLGCPIGTAAEVVSTDSLNKIKNISDIALREHVTLFIVKNPNLFSIHKVRMPYSSNISLTVDTEEDLRFLHKFILTQKDPLKITLKDIWNFEVNRG